ncbi:MAG: hypothetical protein EA424_14110 [Planctomycetaceae bacterium]|nr:MAG: hypothetical protein EA424_14110 [Planctomycetaceae bacterium]
MIHDPPEGSRHQLDLRAKVPVDQTYDPQVAESLLLLRIEIKAPNRERPISVCRWATAHETKKNVWQYGVLVEYIAESGWTLQ